MKKVSILFVSALVSIASFAQGGFSVEVNFDPFSAITPVFSTEGLRVRYFLSEDIALRGTIDFSNDKTTNAAYNSVNGQNSLFSTQTTANTTFGITPGFEYHLVKFAKGSVYAGAEFGVVIGNGSGSTEYAKPDNTFVNSNDKNSSFGFGAGVFTGVDYYITSNLYVGAELGFNYESTKTTPNKSETTGATTVENDSYRTVSNIGFACVPAFRLGWSF